MTPKTRGDGGSVPLSVVVSDMMGVELLFLTQTVSGSVAGRLFSVVPCETFFRTSEKNHRLGGPLPKIVPEAQQCIRDT
jgi:hypothetical protein